MKMYCVTLNKKFGFQSSKVFRNKQQAINYLITMNNLGFETFYSES